MLLVQGSPGFREVHKMRCMSSSSTTFYLFLSFLEFQVTELVVITAFSSKKNCFLRQWALNRTLQSMWSAFWEDLRKDLSYILSWVSESVRKENKEGRWRSVSATLCRLLFPYTCASRDHLPWLVLIYLLYLRDLIFPLER